MGDDCQYYDSRSYNSLRDSDDSPTLSNRHEYRRVAYPTKKEERQRRSTFSVLAKFFIFCTGMIVFCVLMYIPVYNKASNQLTKDLVVGWSKQTNRDTKVYVQPNNVTAIQEPRNICNKHKQNKLFLLIVVCSSTINFDSRMAIRETWGNYKKYLTMSKLYHAVKEKYKNYNYSYDLYSETADFINVTSYRSKRDISSFSQLLPELAKALQDNLVKDKTENVPEKRFEDDDNSMLPEFDMNQELGDQTEIPNYDYYDSNVMKIPPKGYEDNPDLEKVLNLLRKDKNLKENLPKIKEEDEVGNIDPEYKVVFLLGLPGNDNDSAIQNKILEESERYGDVIQEGFIDSYNNLTLKSIMMLKWITNNCNDSVRYILKTDDDMYINVPNLIDNLRNRSRDFDNKTRGTRAKEYMLIGDLICGARPVLDSSNKWYSPRYMYGGRVYPKYLSGTGYALSSHVARALYDAALRTNYFHLEDIFITGMCAGRARPRIVPRDDPTFSYQAAGGPAPAACGAHARATAHRVPPHTMRLLTRLLADKRMLDKCERMRLTKMKQEQHRLYVLYRFLRLLVSNEC
ncbi:uncharacterized protein LOC142984436 [Anticarsia gemmatalis]|uniref:uncharacterized protein LOC142984436 n=1 Tax=Anticarsia gemmatalis TaxID=129554 RepID=UPI003F769707